MNHKEVRIGNLIKFENRIFEIESISQAFLTLNTKEFGIGVVDWNNIEPVILDEEFLLSKDFEKDGDSYRKWSDNGCFEIIFYNRDFYYSSSYEEHPFVKLKFVHKLQNLYFEITGQEL